jgi:deazaflavin-dependent oxidoreductase (nitroreductase family)
MTLLTIRGRKTGRLRTTPVGLFEVEGRRYVFSTFGEVNWVHNLRSAGEAILSHNGIEEKVDANELAIDEAAAVLRTTFEPRLASRFTRRMLRSQYNVTSETSPSDYVNVARLHPVFELSPQLTSPETSVNPILEAMKNDQG